MGFKLRVSAGHRHFDHRAAPYCAVELGYFAAEGISDIDISASGEDELTIAALKRGDIDVGLDISPAKILADHLTGGSLVIIGSMANGVGQVLVGQKSLASVDDLRGRRINVVENGSGVDWHPLRILLRKRGIDPDRDIILIPRAPYPLFRNAKAMFERDEADARMLLHAELPHIQTAGYPVLFDFTQEYPVDYPQRVIVATRAFLAAHPDTVNAFLRAMVRAYRYLRDEANYAATMAILRRCIDDPHLGFPPGITEHFLSTHYFGFKQMPHDGGVSHASLQRYIDEERLEGRVPADLASASVLETGPVREAARVVDARYGLGYA